MININTDNYEGYLLDYFDGNLSDEEIKVLELFIHEHPELAIDLEEPLFELEAESIAMNDKSDLKKVVPFDQLADLAIGEMEGDNSEEESKALKSILKLDPTLTAEVERFKKTKLPVEVIPFPNKKILYKGKTIAFYQRTWVQVAAAAAVLLFMVQLISTGEEGGMSYVASNKGLTNYEPTAELEGINEGLNQLTLVQTTPADTDVYITKPQPVVYERELRENISVPVTYASLDVTGSIFLPEKDTTKIKKPQFNPGNTKLEELLVQIPKLKNYDKDERMEYGTEVLTYLTDGKLAFNKTKDDNGEAVAWKAKVGKYELERKK